MGQEETMTEPTTQAAISDTCEATCSASEIRILERLIKMWRNECRHMCHELADLAGLPREPEPGWRNSIAAIKAKIQNDQVESSEGSEAE